MKGIRRTIALSTVSVMLMGGIAIAQDHHDQDQHDQDQHSHYVRHDDWHKGGRISHDDWQRGTPIDYHAHHLRRPPHGYAWREVDGNYVLAAVATGVIASAIIASQGH